MLSIFFNSTGLTKSNFNCQNQCTYSKFEWTDYEEEEDFCSGRLCNKPSVANRKSEKSKLNCAFKSNFCTQWGRGDGYTHYFIPKIYDSKLYHTKVTFIGNFILSSDMWQITFCWGGLFNKPSVARQTNWDIEAKWCILKQYYYAVGVWIPTNCDIWGTRLNLEEGIFSPANLADSF